LSDHIIATFSLPASEFALLLFQNAFQDRIVQCREAEFNHLKKERDERTTHLISSRKHERETVRKLMFYLNMEEQRLEKQREEEEARKREGKLMLTYCV
jgi:translation initiation factor 3 subunit A